MIRTPRPMQSLLCCAAFSILSVFVSAQDSKNPFDGKSLSAWTTIDGSPAPKGWEVIDGVIHLKKSEERTGHIVTASEFGDFVLSFEWKIAPGGNSGIKYRVRAYGERVIGCEYQIYDDACEKKVEPKNSSGALYDLYEPNAAKKLNPAGQWNRAKIVVQGNHLEHWLNGEKVVDATIGDNEWKKRLAESKFNEHEDFSRQPKGKLMLTDHGSEVWYRNFVLEQ